MRREARFIATTEDTSESLQIKKVNKLSLALQTRDQLVVLIFFSLDKELMSGSFFKNILNISDYT